MDVGGKNPSFDFEHPGKWLRAWGAVGCGQFHFRQFELRVVA